MANEPMSDDEIAATSVGEVRPLNGPIHLAPYEPAWPSLFDQLKKKIESALGHKVLLLEHVGSTSVPGLSAKPAIDMVLAVTDSSDEAGYVKPLEEAGYVLRIREPNWHQHRMLKSSDPDGNLHVFSEGSEEIRRMVLLRDWLRNHREDRARYDEAKRDLAKRIWKYTQNYADEKAEVVKAVLARARRGET